MKKLTFIYLGIVIAALCSCNGRKMMAQLDEISKIADDNPDSALTLLSKFDTDKNEWGKGDRMHYESRILLPKKTRIRRRNCCVP